MKDELFGFEIDRLKPVEDPENTCFGYISPVASLQKRVQQGQVNDQKELIDRIDRLEEDSNPVLFLYKSKNNLLIYNINRYEEKTLHFKPGRNIGIGRCLCYCRKFGYECLFLEGTCLSTGRSLGRSSERSDPTGTRVREMVKSLLVHFLEIGRLRNKGGGPPPSNLFYL